MEAYVLSFDYYHIMATPEWEDADFEGDIVDDFFPDWWGVKLNGFVRPRWFVAAPLDISIRYILSEVSGSSSRNILWQCANFERWLICRKSRFRKFTSYFLYTVLGHRIEYLNCPAQGPGALMLGNLIAFLARSARHLGLRTGSLIKLAGRLKRSGRGAQAQSDTRRAALAQRYGRVSLPALNNELRKLGRTDHTTDLTHMYRWWCHPLMKLLLDQFDFVQAYATYTAIPFLVGHRDYIAYEHGTIRNIPFHKTDEGRLCTASYRKAAIVCITNTDNLNAVKELQLEPSRIVCLPHAFNSKKLESFCSEMAHVAVGHSEPIVFMLPSRQHWKNEDKDDANLAKGSERVFYALRNIKDSGRTCRLRAIEWGRDLERSKTLVEELGIEEMVEWLLPMKKRKLWTTYMQSHAVLDQFEAPAIGGVTFEAMMLGRRVITHLDTEQNEIFFGEAPPVLKASTIDEITAAMAAVIEDPSDCAQLGAECQAWMKKYHSADRIMSLQAEIYAKISSRADRKHIAVSDSGSAPRQ